MLTTVSLCESRIVKIQGSARSGKTEALVRRVAALIGRGVSPDQILVAVPSRFAADAFRARLAKAVEPGLVSTASRVVVERPLETCCSVLDAPAARAATGRVPRVLNDSEELFFLEDMKTLGQKNGRLRNMLMFFYAQWSKFEDEAGWLLPGEEASVLSHARTVLGGLGAMLRHEAPYLCGKLLLSDEGQSLAHRYAYVLADDYQDYSQAEQVCLGLCARDQMMVCGDASLATKVNTEYPNPDGFLKFERVRRNVELFELQGSHGIDLALRMGESLRLYGETAVDSPSLLNPGERPAAGDRGDVRGVVAGVCTAEYHDVGFLKWTTPGSELEGVCRSIRSYLAADPSRVPSDVTVAVPTKGLGALVCRALAAGEIATSDAGLNPRLGGDPRGAGYHDALTSYVALCLVADPRDMVAWRAWTGFDNAIANSEAWGSLYRRGSEERRDLYDVLARAVAEAAGDPVLKTETLRRAWDAGQQVIASCRDLRGRELAESLGMASQPVFGEVLAAMEDDEDALGLLDRVRVRLTSPAWPQDEGLVHVALYENLRGTQVPCLIMPGMVDGLLPAREVFEIDKTDDARRRVLSGDRARLRSCITAGTELLVGSAFVQADLEVAERLHMRIERVASVGGQRTCVVSPSLYFDEAGESFTGFADGETANLEEFFSVAPASVA